jgi:glycosyltransferase involved in cell wall biosynthesis
VHFSFLQNVPGVEKFYKWLLPLLPVAVESFDLTQYDFVLSSSHCVAKGGVIAPHAKHVCYLHSPMRYAWDQEHAYFNVPPMLSKPWEILRRMLLSRLRIWDQSTNHRIDAFVANSEFVASRVQRYYGRKSQVVYPSVELHRFLAISGSEDQCSRRNKSKSILFLSAWVPYKKLSEAFEVLAAEGHNIIAAGSGSELKRMRQKWQHKGPNLKFVESPTDEDVVSLFAQCHTFVFPALEDFGIVVVEALAAGLKVVVPNKGGAAEIVARVGAGKLFSFGSEESLKSAVRNSLAEKITPEEIASQRTHLNQFTKTKFQSEMLSILCSQMGAF